MSFLYLQLFSSDRELTRDHSEYIKRSKRSKVKESENEELSSI